MGKCAWFAHPKQKNRNGSLYNNKPGITLKQKIIKTLNKLWNWRNIHAYLLIQWFKSFGPHGANGLEQIHSTLNKLLLYLKNDGVGLKRLPAISAIQKLAIVYRRLDKILHEQTAKLYHEHPGDIAMLNDMYQEICKIRGFKELSSSFDEFGHNLLYFEEASIDINHYTNNLDWEGSLDTRTALQWEDQQVILQFVDENQAVLEDNDGYLHDHTALAEIGYRLKKQVSGYEVAKIARSFWYRNYDSDDDWDEKQLQQDSLLRRLKNTQKKASEYNGDPPSHNFKYNNNIQSLTHKYIYRLFHHYGDRNKTMAQCREIYTGIQLPKPKRKKTKKSTSSNTNKNTTNRRGRRNNNNNNSNNTRSKSKTSTSST